MGKNDYCTKKMKFFIKDFFNKCNKIPENCEFFMFIEEILNGKLHFLCSELCICHNICTKIYLILQTDHFNHYLLEYHQSKHEDLMQARITCKKVPF